MADQTTETNNIVHPPTPPNSPNDPSYLTSNPVKTYKDASFIEGNIETIIENENENEDYDLDDSDSDGEKEKTNDNQPEIVDVEPPSENDTFMKKLLSGQISQEELDEMVRNLPPHLRKMLNKVEKPKESLSKEQIKEKFKNRMNLMKTNRGKNKAEVDRLEYMEEYEKTMKNKTGNKDENQTENQTEKKNKKRHKKRNSKKSNNSNNANKLSELPIEQALEYICS